MTTKQAIESLDSMQSQIIHGKRTFGDIADVIRNLEAVRLAALEQVGKHEESVGASDYLYAAHRILANSNPSGVFIGGVVNSANGELCSVRKTT